MSQNLNPRSRLPVWEVSCQWTEKGAWGTIRASWLLQLRSSRDAVSYAMSLVPGDDCTVVRVGVRPVPHEEWTANQRVKEDAR